MREYKYWPIQETNFDSQPERGTWHAGIALKYHISPIFGVRVDVGVGTLNGTKRRIYQSYFRANYEQITASGTVNFTNLLSATTRASHWAIEPYVGIGIIRFRSTAYQLGSGFLLRRSKDNALVFPLGLTASYAVSPHFQVFMDARYNAVTNDLLDATMPASGPNKMDSYAWGALGLAYQWKK